MPAKFNLLPKDSSLNKDVLRLTKALKVAITAIVVTACVGGMAGASMIYYYTNLLNKEKDQYQSMRSTVTSLENTEQSLVLIKDRAQKLAEILNSRQNATTFLKQKALAANLPENVSFSGNSIQQTESRLDLVSGNSRSLADLLKALPSGELETVVVRQITYNPSVGYMLSLYVQ